MCPSFRLNIIRGEFVTITGKTRSQNDCDINLNLFPTFSSAHCVPDNEVDAKNMEMSLSPFLPSSMMKAERGTK